MQDWTHLVSHKAGTRTHHGKLLTALVASFGTGAPSTQAAAETSTHAANISTELASQEQSVVGNLCSNAYLFANFDLFGGYNYLRTVHKGRGFRYYSVKYDFYGRQWVFGHSAEAPLVNGWILSYHLCR